MTPLAAVVLGILQGVAEWIPVSSEAVLVLAMTWLGHDPGTAVAAAVWLHTGTMLAALLYFRDEFMALAAEVPRRKASPLLAFLVLATLVTGGIGGAVYVLGVERLVQHPDLFAGATGALLLVTGLLHLRGRGADRGAADADLGDAAVAGGLQGLAILPGVSRSGVTVFGLLHRDFDGEAAFRLSFLMSVPAIFAANVGLEVLGRGVALSPEMLLAGGVAFITGYAAIDVVLRVARRTGVAYLCFGLAVLALAPVLL
ncbi:MAG: undecaprenyl-diphosphate phosphatase [Candidatus Nanohaloarchaea archaeon]|nr:undecaprenyl-diphosphate phosphatase [Candidatus Nanohaloarchaea archaeon]